MPGFRLTIDVKLVTYALANVSKGLTTATPGPIRDAMKQANLRWMVFIRRRFLNASRGDGTWPPLAESTKLARLRKKFSGYGRRIRDILGLGPPSAESAIQIAKLRGKRAAEGRKFQRQLTATGLATRKEQISAVLNGYTFEILRDTGTLFNSLSEGDPQRVEQYGNLSMSVGTAVRYAKHHQSPTIPGRPPERAIFVLPDDATRQAMRADMERGAVKLLEQAGLK